jgi:hypothetical protein
VNLLRGFGSFCLFIPPPEFLAVFLIPPSTSAGLMEEMGGSVQISKSLEANLTFAGVMITFSPEI